MSATFGNIVPLGNSCVEWEFENFNSKIEHMNFYHSSYKLYSPPFKLFETNLYFCLHCFSSMTRCFIFLVISGSNNVKSVQWCEMGIKGADGNIYNSLKFPVSPSDIYGVWYGVDRTCFTDKSLLANNAAVLYCTVFKNDKEDVASQASLYEDDAVFNQNIADMYLKERSCDVILKIGKNEFKAHKFILIARSEVFASMFEHDMSEKKSGIVNIEDCDPTAFHDFLLFLYTAKIDFEKSSPEKMLFLYCIAHKYQVLELKKICINFLVRNLSVDNFCDVLALALKYDEKELLKYSENLFLEKAKDILITVQWQSFHKENMTVANELFIKYAQKN